VACTRWVRTRCIVEQQHGAAIGGCDSRPLADEAAGAALHEHSSACSAQSSGPQWRSLVSSMGAAVECGPWGAGVVLQGARGRARPAAVVQGSCRCMPIR
jgi:hypothetical protein